MQQKVYMTVHVLRMYIEFIEKGHKQVIDFIEIRNGREW